MTSYRSLSEVSLIVLVVVSFVTSASAPTAVSMTMGSIAMGSMMWGESLGDTSSRENPHRGTPKSRTTHSHPNVSGMSVVASIVTSITLVVASIVASVVASVRVHRSNIIMYHVRSLFIGKKIAWGNWNPLGAAIPTFWFRISHWKALGCIPLPL